MNINSFILRKELLPITVKLEENDICYYFEEDYDGYLLSILETEMPGVIIGDIDEELLSVSIHNGQYFGYLGQEFSEYYEPIDSNRSIGSIKEVFCCDNEFSLYKHIFKYKKTISRYSILQVGIVPLEDLFYSSFAEKGFKKSSIIEKSNHDGYIETLIVFNNDKGDELKVFYPEYDYIENSESFTLNLGIAFNWSDFIKAMRTGGILGYPGIMKKN